MPFQSSGNVINSRQKQIFQITPKCPRIYKQYSSVRREDWGVKMKAKVIFVLVEKTRQQRRRESKGKWIKGIHWNDCNLARNSFIPQTWVNAFFSVIINEIIISIHSLIRFNKQKWGRRWRHWSLRRHRRRCWSRRSE